MGVDHCCWSCPVLCGSVNETVCNNIHMYSLHSALLARVGGLLSNCIYLNDWIMVKLVQNFASFITANVSHSHHTPPVMFPLGLYSSWWSSHIVCGWLSYVITCPVVISCLGVSGEGVILIFYVVHVQRHAILKDGTDILTGWYFCCVWCSSTHWDTNIVWGYYF